MLFDIKLASKPLKTSQKNFSKVNFFLQNVLNFVKSVYLCQIYLLFRLRGVNGLEPE